jgi:hypothetical protein
VWAVVGQLQQQPLAIWVTPAGCVETDLAVGEVDFATNQAMAPVSPNGEELAEQMNVIVIVMPGCPQCVVYERQVRHGASERMVLTAPTTRPTLSCTSRAGNPDIPCQRTIATSTAIGWKGGRCPWRVSPWRVP